MAYESKISDFFKPLKINEKFAVRDTAGAVKLMERLDSENGRVTILNVTNVVKTEVHNDKVKSGDTDYINVFIMTEEGDVFYSSSATLWDDLKAMVEIIKEESEEVYSFDISVIVVPSKNNVQGFIKAKLLDVRYVM